MLCNITFFIFAVFDLQWRRQTQHRLCIGVHNSSAGVRSATLRSHPHEAYRLYNGGVVYDGHRPRPQSSETTFASVNSSWALTTGAARPSNINLYKPINVQNRSLYAS